MELEIIEEIKRLYQNGENVTDINKKMKISNASEVIKQLLKEGKIDIIQRNKAKWEKKLENKMNNETKKQYGEIEKLCKLNYSIVQISKRLGIEDYKVRNIVNDLKMSGKINEDEKERKHQEQRRIIKQEYENGALIGEIIKTAHVQYNNLLEIIEEMKKQGLFDEAKREKALEKRKKEKSEESIKEIEKLQVNIKKLYEEGNSQDSIRKSLHISIKKLKEYLNSMQKNGLIDEEKRKDNIKKVVNRKRKELEKRVKSEYEKGIGRVEIAKQEGVSYKIIKDIIDQMLIAGRIKLPENEKEKRTRIKIEYNAGVPKTHIARNEKIAYTTLDYILKEMRENGQLDESRRNIAINLLKDSKDRIKEENEINILAIKKLVNNFVEAKEFDEAIIFLDCIKGTSYTSNKNKGQVKYLAEEQKNDIVAIQDLIKKRLNKMRAVEMLKDKIAIDEIAEKLNLTLQEVRDIKKKMEDMNKKEEQAIEIA